VRITIKRYRISRRAALELKALRLTIGDVAVILRWGEKRKAGDMTSYLFERRCLPSGQEKKLMDAEEPIYLSEGDDQPYDTPSRFRNATGHSKR
jgi:hypothetical protein